MTSLNRPPNISTPGLRWMWLYTIGSLAAMAIFVLFLIGMIGIIPVAPRPSSANNPFTQFQNNWLVVLFKLSAGFPEAHPDLLQVLNPVDILLMVLMGVMFLALNPALRHTSKIWSLIAAVLPFLGIPIFLITSTAGRSALLVGGLIISIVMRRSPLFSTVSTYMGMVASALLFFVGDLATVIFSASPILAILVGIGYVLWMIWFLLMALKLFQFRQGLPGRAAT